MKILCKNCQLPKLEKDFLKGFWAKSKNAGICKSCRRSKTNAKYYLKRKQEC